MAFALAITSCNGYTVSSPAMAQSSLVLQKTANMKDHMCSADNLVSPYFHSYTKQSHVECLRGQR